MLCSVRGSALTNTVSFWHQNPLPLETRTPDSKPAFGSWETCRASHRPPPSVPSYSGCKCSGCYWPYQVAPKPLDDPCVVPALWQQGAMSNRLACRKGSLGPHLCIAVASTKAAAEQPPIKRHRATILQRELLLLGLHKKADLLSQAAGWVLSSFMIFISCAYQPYTE